MDERPPRVRGLSELVLIVGDVARSASFYRDVVGLVPEREPNDAWAWFRLDHGAASETAQRIALRRGSLLFEEHSPNPPGERWGCVHFALSVAREDLDQMVAHIRSHGVEVFGPTDLEWMHARSYYFYDPDGNLVELWSPEPRC